MVARNQSFSGARTALETVRYFEAEMAAVATSAGVATATFDEVPSGMLWRVEMLAVSTTSVLATTAKAYVGSVDPKRLRLYTDAGNGDVAGGDPPVLVPSGRSLIVQWSGATAGATCTVTLQVELVQMVTRIAEAY